MFNTKDAFFKGVQNSYIFFLIRTFKESNHSKKHCLQFLQYFKPIKITYDNNMILTQMI